MVSTAVPHVKASLAGLILLAEPIGTYAIDVLFFTARPTPMALAGMALTLAAIYAGSDRKSTRLNSSHSQISYAVFCLKKKKKKTRHPPSVFVQTGLQKTK